MVHPPIAQPARVQDQQQHGKRIRFANSWGVMVRLRAERGVHSRDSNQRYDPSQWTSPQTQVHTAIEPATALSRPRPRDDHPRQWQACATLTPRDWLQLTTHA